MTEIVRAEDGWMTQEYVCEGFKVSPVWGKAALVQASIVHQYDRCEAFTASVKLYFVDRSNLTFPFPFVADSVAVAVHVNGGDSDSATMGNSAALKALGSGKIEERVDSAHTQGVGCASSGEFTRPQQLQASTPQLPRNLVLASGANRTFEELKLFAESCAQFVTSGACVIFRSAADRTGTAVPGSWRRLANVHFVYSGTDYAPTIPDMAPTDDSTTRQLARPAIGDFAHGRTYIGMLASFKDYLHRHPCSFDKLMYIDPENAMFQSDPFDRVTKGLHVLAEAVGLREVNQQNMVNAIHDPADDSALRDGNATMWHIREPGGYGHCVTVVVYSRFRAPPLVITSRVEGSAERV